MTTEQKAEAFDTLALFVRYENNLSPLSSFLLDLCNVDACIVNRREYKEAEYGGAESAWAQRERMLNGEY